MLYTINLNAPVSFQLRPKTRTEEILQNVRLLCATRKGAVPHYRDFGLSWDWLDKPVPVAQAMLHVELRDALAQYEPRAELGDVSFSGDSSAPENLIVTLELEIAEEEQT